MQPIIHGKAQKPKTLYVLMILSYIFGIINLIIAIISIPESTPSSIIIISENTSSAVINHDEIKCYILAILGALLILFDVISSIYLYKHKNDSIYVYENNINFRSKTNHKKIDYSYIIECSLINERKRKLLGDTIILKTKLTQQAYYLLNINDAEEIVETINKKLNK